MSDTRAGYIDRASEVRGGEELAIERLEPYLLDQLPAATAPLVVEQFPSGYSNLTYLLRLGDRELVLRRPPFGNRVKSAHDMGREFRVLSALQGVYPLAPEPLLHCQDEDILGAPFYVMERRQGIVLRQRLPKGLQLPPVLIERLSGRLIDNLAALHCLDIDAIGLADFGRLEGYVERQVGGWWRRYQRAQTDAWPQLDEAAAWLLDNLPPESGAALIHNDYKYDNVLLDAKDLTQLVAVLDWEMATVGDPLMDLGTTLAYWVEADDPEPFRQAAFGPTALPGSFTRQQLADRYAERTGADLGDLTFYFCFGLVKLAVIVQQIYYRYAQGHTADPRFAQLNHLVGMLGQIAASSIERGRI